MDSYMEFLREIDSEIKKMLPGEREQVKHIMFKVWGNVFPSNSISQFCQELQQLKDNFPTPVWEKANAIVNKALLRYLVMNEREMRVLWNLL